MKKKTLSKTQTAPKRPLHRLVGLRGTVRCVRCGTRHSDMPLDKLNEYACAKYNLKAGQPCGGALMQVKKPEQPNDEAQTPRAND